MHENRGPSAKPTRPQYIQERLKVQFASARQLKQLSFLWHLGHAAIAMLPCVKDFQSGHHVLHERCKHQLVLWQMVGCERDRQVLGGTQFEQVSQ